MADRQVFVEAGKKGVRVKRRMRKAEKEMAYIGALGDFLGGSKDIIVEFVRAANTSNLVGFTSSLILILTAYRLRIIDHVGLALGLAGLGLIEGSTLTVSVLNALAADITAIGGLIKPINLVNNTPSGSNPLSTGVTTLVLDTGGKNVDLQALMRLRQVEVK